jgi:hypothetical protein
VISHSSSRIPAGEPNMSRHIYIQRYINAFFQFAETTISGDKPQNSSVQESQEWWGHSWLRSFTKIQIFLKKWNMCNMSSFMSSDLSSWLNSQHCTASQSSLLITVLRPDAESTCVTPVLRTHSSQWSRTLKEMRQLHFSCWNRRLTWIQII